MTAEEILNLEKAQQVISVGCTSCGSEMVFSPKHQKLLCEHCGNKRELPRGNDLIVEKPYTTHIDLSCEACGFGHETKVFHCESCGSETAVEPDTVAFECPFCGSRHVNTEAHAAKVIQPSGTIPFKITKHEALDKYKNWIKKGWFHPNKLRKIAFLDKIAGIYAPFWTYDADTRSSWTAEAGYYYYVSESYRDSDGTMKTRQVRKTRWVPANGYYEHFFDDVLVVGSNGIKQDMVEKIYPYDLKETINYDPNYILGWNSEVYQKDVEEGYRVAEGIMDKFIYNQCARQVPGDTHRGLRVSTQKSFITFKHLLLPVWVAGYRYKNKVFQFLVNGQTGKITGTKPLSFWKIFFTVLLILALGVGIYFLLEGSGAFR